MGNRGPFRGEPGEASEGSIRTFAFVRWLGHVPADSSSYAMFSIMDFMPTLASIVGGKMPTDRPIDGLDQSEVLFGKSAAGHRENLLTFVGSELVAESGGDNSESSSPTSIRPARAAAAARDRIGGFANGWLPKVHNIEADPHEDECRGPVPLGHGPSS